MAGRNNKAVYSIPQDIHEHFNISYSTANSSVVLWSRNQLLLYDTADFNSAPIVIPLNFQIEKVLIHKYVLCLDCDKNIKINKINSGHQLAEDFNRTTAKLNNIIACEIINKEYIASFQFKDNGLKLFINEFNRIFDSQNEFNIKLPDKDAISHNQGKNIVASDNVKTEYLQSLKYMDVKDCNLECTLLVFTLDKVNVYACLVPKKMNKLQNECLKVLKVFKSCSEVVDIKINIAVDISVFIGLSGGNVVKAQLQDTNQKPEVFHLNIPLYKFTMIRNTIIYTDGLTMWKNDNLLSNTEFDLHQFFVRNVRDFCVKENQIICITFSNLIYTFLIDQEDSYKQMDDECLAVELVTNSHYMTELMNVTKKNEEVSKKLDKESEYLTAVSLSKRGDLMDSVIQVTADVFDNYMDLTRQDIEITLTDNLNEYIDSQTYYFLISLSVATIQHKLNKLISNILGDIKIHVKIFENKVLKSTSIKVKERLKKKNYAIPLKRNNIKNVNNVHVQVQIVTVIPGKLDENQKQWIVLYQKSINLNPVQFVKTKLPLNTICLKQDEAPLETLIYKIAEHLHGASSSFKISNELRYKWSVYLKLPADYKQILNDKASYSSNLEKKIDMLLKQSSVSMSNNWLEFEVGNEKVELSIEGKKSKVLIVSCSDIKIATAVRNLFSQIMFASYKNCKPGAVLVDQELYTIIENQRREIMNWTPHYYSMDEFLAHFSQVQKIIFSSLPI